MKNKLTELDKFNINFIKININGYKLLCEHYTMREIVEVVRLNTRGSLKDMPQPITLKDLDCLLFITKHEGINYALYCKKKGEKFELYEMTLSLYNQYEKEFRTANELLDF